MLSNNGFQTLDEDWPSVTRCAQDLVRFWEAVAAHPDSLSRRSTLAYYQRRLTLESERRLLLLDASLPAAAADAVREE